MNTQKEAFVVHVEGIENGRLKIYNGIRSNQILIKRQDCGIVSQLMIISTCSSNGGVFQGHLRSHEHEDYLFKRCDFRPQIFLSDETDQLCGFPDC